ncbi:hypothetical protein [Desulfurobacterium sp.]
MRRMEVVKIKSTLTGFRANGKQGFIYANIYDIYLNGKSHILVVGTSDRERLEKFIDVDENTASISENPEAFATQVSKSILAERLVLPEELIFVYYETRNGTTTYYLLNFKKVIKRKNYYIFKKPDKVQLYVCRKPDAREFFKRLAVQKTGEE